MESSFQQRDDLLWAAFRVFDTDGDGEITVEELAKVLHTEEVGKSIGGPSASSEEKQAKVRALIDEFDKNKDGVIDFEEFKAMMKAEQAVE